MKTTSTRFQAIAIAVPALVAGLFAAPALAGTFQTNQHEFIHRSMGQTTREARSVGSIIGGYSEDRGVVQGSGVLVGSRFVVTAAHLVDDMRGGSFEINGQFYGIRRSVVANSFYDLITEGDNPSFNPEERLYGGGSDIALIELTRPVAGARNLKATLNKSRKEVGRTATIVGYGRPGSGSQGINVQGIPSITIPNDASFGNQTAGVWDFQPVKRAGKNVVEPLSPFAARTPRELTVDFDPSPDQLASLAAAGLNPPAFDPFTGEFDVDEDDIPVSAEFMPSVGDSGGGLFINGRLAGITSWTTRANSEFFGQANFTRISVGWWKWIQKNIAAFNRLNANPGLVPWVSETNPILPGAGFKNVLRIRRGEPFEDNDTAGRPENAGTRTITRIFGPGLWSDASRGDLPAITVETNLDANDFIFNDRFADSAPLPEPASLALLGLGGLAILRRTRR